MPRNLFPILQCANVPHATSYTPPQMPEPVSTIVCHPRANRKLVTTAPSMFYLKFKKTIIIAMMIKSTHTLTIYRQTVLPSDLYILKTVL